MMSELQGDAGGRGGAGRSATQALLLFSVGLLGLVVGAEAAARASSGALEAAAHRVRFKAELLARQGPLRFVAIGTSRFNDGVAPPIVGAAFRRAGREGRAGDAAEGDGPRARGFNASVPSSSIAAQVYLANRALAHAGVDTLFLEVSSHQVAALNDDTLEPHPGGAGEGLEARALLASAIVRSRRAFMVENLPRLWGLAFADGYDGSEFFRTRWLLASLGAPSSPPPIGPPRRFCPGDGAPAGTDVGHREALEAWVALAERARAKGVTTYFVAPPIAPAHRGQECAEPWLGLWRALAARSGSVVLSWGCAEVPDALFSDRDHHLGWAGRAAFSDALGAEWAELLARPACEPAR